MWLIMSEYLLFVGKSRRSHLKVSFLSDVLVCSELVIIQVLRPSPRQWFSDLFLEAEKTTHPTLKFKTEQSIIAAKSCLVFKQKSYLASGLFFPTNHQWSHL